jgi:Tol biopolymer transport system component
MNRSTATLAVALALLAGCGDSSRSRLPLAPGAPRAGSSFDLVSTIAFSSTRDDPTNPRPATAGEIYLMDSDGTNLRRLTYDNTLDAFATLSPDGKKIVFTSARIAGHDAPQSISDLFVMDTDGENQTWVIRGSSATWSPDGKDIAFHASASGAGLPIKGDPGAATFDSDIFVVNLDDALSGAATRRNITNSPDAIDDDADWSPDGQKIAFTSHSVSDNPQNSVTAEIYTTSPYGGPLERLTNNTEEERAPSWSPDGSRICYMCHHGGSDFEICVMNADGSGQTQLTDNSTFEATPTWSPDGSQIVFHRTVGGLNQLFVMNPDGTGQTQLTSPPGFNQFASWGELRVHDQGSALRSPALNPGLRAGAQGP